jgi:hypothetical protein
LLAQHGEAEQLRRLFLLGLCEARLEARDLGGGLPRLGRARGLALRPRGLELRLVGRRQRLDGLCDGQLGLRGVDLLGVLVGRPGLCLGALDGALDGASERAAEKKSAPPAPPGFEVISSPLIYDDLFRQVRQWTRLGFSPAQIQGELDTRFAHIHEVMLAQHWSRHVAADATKEGSEAAAT